jgi:hypothetical protein
LENTALTVFGVIAIILLAVFSYSPITDRLSQADVQTMLWGRVLSVMFPLFLTVFAFAGICVLIVVSSKGATPK